MQSDAAQEGESAAGEAGGQQAIPGLVVPGDPSALPATTPRTAFPAALLALGSVRGMGTKGLQAVVRILGDRLGILFELDPADLRGTLARAHVSASVANAVAEDRSRLLDEAETQLDRLADRGVRALGPGQIPHRLAELRDGPLWLFAQGDPSALAVGLHVAVVGTRTASAEGVRAAQAAVRTMAAYPMTLVSGLARVL